MRLLVFGRTGQVGTELGRIAAANLHITALGREEADLKDAPACADWIRCADADVIINAAAFTAVDKAEDEEDWAMAINGVAPGAMADAAAARGIPFLHVSTDYVFDGGKDAAWVESDPVAPLGAYGRSKLAGEQAIQAAGGPHAILRTAWVFSAHGSNFLKTMLRAGEGRDELKVVDDQYGGPTPAASIAEALVDMAQAFVAGNGVSGVFHFAGQPATTWCGFAREIFAQSGWDKVPKVIPIRTEDWPTPAIRPMNSVLDCSLIQNTYGISQPDWCAGIGTVLADLRETT
ncbi:MAG: dTDP-4-dehydrorhamnose reductase [Pseudomonadota bacterium]